MKIQIIEQVISSLCSINNLDTLSADDFKCLLDHLAKEASLLLRKGDRCKILLMIIPLNLDIDAKYTDQMVSLLCQLPDDTNENSLYHVSYSIFYLLENCVVMNKLFMIGH